MNINPVSLLLLSSPFQDSAGFVVVIGASLELESLNASYNASLQLNHLRIVNEKKLPVSDSCYNDILEKCSVSAVIQSVKPKNLKTSISATPIRLLVDSLGLLNVSRVFMHFISFAPHSESDKTKSVPQKIRNLDVLETSVRIPNIRLVCASNRYNSLVPVVLFELRDILSALDEISTHTRMSLSFTITAQYFKKQYSQWETFIEPFFLSCLYSQLLSHKEPISKLIISTVQTLNVNVTHSLLSAIYQYERELDLIYVLMSSNKSFSITDTPSRQFEDVENGDLISNVCLVNHSGLALSVEISDRHNSISLNQTNYQVRDATAVYTTLPAYPSLRQNYSREHRANVSYDAVIYCDNFQTGRIPIFGEDIIVMKSIKNQALVARSQTSFERKEILISGRVDVINNTGQNLFYSFDDVESAMSRGFQTPLEPLPKNCTVYSPVLVSNNGVFSLAADATYSMFEQSAITRLDISSLEQNEKELCVSIGHSHLTVRIYINVVVVSSIPLIHIELLPGLKVYNLLYCPMEYVIMDKSKTRGECLGFA